MNPLLPNSVIVFSDAHAYHFGSFIERVWRGSYCADPNSTLTLTLTFSNKHRRDAIHIRHRLCRSVSTDPRNQTLVVAWQPHFYLPCTKLKHTVNAGSRLQSPIRPYLSLIGFHCCTLLRVGRPRRALFVDPTASWKGICSMRTCMLYAACRVVAHTCTSERSPKKPSRLIIPSFTSRSIYCMRRPGIRYRILKPLPAPGRTSAHEGLHAEGGILTFLEASSPCQKLPFLSHSLPRIPLLSFPARRRDLGRAWSGLVTHTSHTYHTCLFPKKINVPFPRFPQTVAQSAKKTPFSTVMV